MNLTHIILYAIVPIVVIMLLGYVLGKKGAFNGNDAKRFNKVVLDIALPAALWVSIVQASREDLAVDLKLTIVSTVGIMACFMAVYFVFRYCFKKNTGADAAVSALISGSPTIGFLGFAVLEPIFGTSPKVALVVAIVGIVVNAIGIPVGLSLMNSSLDKQKASESSTPGSAGQAINPHAVPVKKTSAFKPVLDALKKPVAWAPIAAVIWVLIGIPWPEWASPSFDLISKANASMAVLSAGITLSACQIKINAQAWVGLVMKMIMMPAVLLIFGMLVKMDPTNLKMLVVAGALPPAFSGIIIADEYGTYVSTGTTSLALSMVSFVAFCPIWIAITDMCITHFM